VSHGRATIGVIGGMGPDATVDFFAKLIAASHGGRDQDHLRVVIDNDPSVPDRTAAIEGRGESPAPQLARMARGLIVQGATVLVMPCNSAHAFAAAIVEAAAGVPFLDLIETTVAATRRRLPGVTRVGLLATDGTLAARLYHDAYRLAGIEALAPCGDDQLSVMAAIYAVKRGGANEAELMRLRLACERLVDEGAEALIAGCTEIPLLMQEGDIRRAGVAVPLISSTDELVARTLAHAGMGTQASA
jgi:aspartate racemase